MQDQDDCWWKSRIFYQIYPISFYDSNGDGIGDLQGIREKLPYIKDLGVGGIWISPFYQSPLEYDFGYGPADLYAINPLFGSMEDFENLLAEAHELDLAVLLDWAVTNTSIHSEWFLESRSSRTNPKSDWYIWSDGIPNNWVAFGGGGAWNYCPERNQYYLGLFFPQHAELNWRNAEVQEAIFNAFEFWMKKGIDGFRMDTVGTYFKDKSLRDNPVTEVDYQSLLDPDDPIQNSRYRKYLVPEFLFFDHIHDCHQPESVEILRKLRQLADKYRKDALLIGETSIDNEMGKTLCRNGLSTSFDFALINAEWGAGKFREILLRHQEEINAYHCCFAFSNHDSRRSIARYAGKNRSESCAKARLLATLTATLRGLPVFYYGEEIGQEDVDLKYQELRDPMSRSCYHIDMVREAARGPMRWDDSVKCGFTTGDPWMRTFASEGGISVSAQAGQEGSMLEFHRSLINLRNATRVLQTGEIDFVDNENDKVLAYRRYDDMKSCLILLNFDAEAQSVSHAQLKSTADSCRELIASNGVCEINDIDILLPGFCAVVIEEN